MTREGMTQAGAAMIISGFLLPFVTMAAGIYWNIPHGATLFAMAGVLAIIVAATGLATMAAEKNFPRRRRNNRKGR